MLLQLKEGNYIRFRCHTGHAYSVDTLLAEFAEQTEETLWNAIRSLEESSMLMNKMASQLRSHNHPESASELESKASEAMGKANKIRDVVMNYEKVSQQNISTEDRKLN